MKGAIEKEKGTLVHVFIEFEDGQFVEFSPLHNDIGIILFDAQASKDINCSFGDISSSIVGINHKGEVVGQYKVSSCISTVMNTVLYPDGKVWIGPILEGDEDNAEWMVLTERALNLLKDPSGFSFDAPTREQRPTVLVKLRSSVLPLCGSHTCAPYCREFDKFIENSANRKTL
jgi:hypothetical protein